MQAAIDLNKLYEPMREGMSLAQLATEISGLYAAGDDLRLSLLVRLHEAKRLVDAREGTNLSWEAWCAANIRKPNGTPYSTQSIGRMLRMANSANPQKTLECHRAIARNYGSKTVYLHTRGRLRGVVGRAPAQTKIDEIAKLQKQGLKVAEIAETVSCDDKTVRNILSGRTRSKEYWAERAREDTIKGQVEQFLVLWERMEPEARRQALHAINARIIT